MTMAQKSIATIWQKDEWFVLQFVIAKAFERLVFRFSLTHKCQSLRFEIMNQSAKPAAYQ